MGTWKIDSLVLAVGFALAGAAAAVATQSQTKPGHERVPPLREPSPYMSAAEIQTALNALDPTLVASRTGGFDSIRGR